MTAQRTILIAGASGVVGQAAVAAFTAGGDWQVIALSRRPPDLAPGRWRHLAVDLRDAAAVPALPEVTHLVYAALYEMPGLIRGWREREQMATNLAMLQNLLGKLGPALKHVSLFQGTKAYGAHLHPIAVPAREDRQRDRHENFYWLQEDLLRGEAAARGLGFTIWRPQVVFGEAVGVAMNLIPILGLYAAICREEGLPFAFPGGPDYVLEAVDAHLIARALTWAAEAPTARDETFNITNGDVMVWRHAWPAIAQMLGVVTGPDEPRMLADWLPAKAGVWDRIVQRHGLRPIRLAELLGESHHYADFCFASHAKGPPPPVLVSTIKLRQAGFADCVDTEQMFRALFRRMAEKRLLPRPS